MLDPEKDNNNKKFWKYIKSRKQDTMGIDTLKNNGVLAEIAELCCYFSNPLVFGPC
jgi:hypothetical protein